MITNFKIFERDVTSNSQLTDGEKSNLEFRIGDYVRIKNANVLLDIYEIDKISVHNNFYSLKGLGNSDFYGWRKEDVLERVPDYEVKAMKYNL